MIFLDLQYMQLLKSICLTWPARGCGSPGGCGGGYSGCRGYWPLGGGRIQLGWTHTKLSSIVTYTGVTQIYTNMQGKCTGIHLHSFSIFMEHNFF